MTFSQRIKNSFGLRKTAVTTAGLPDADAPTRPLAKVELPAVGARMIRVAISGNPKQPNQRRRALFYEDDFYNTLKV